MVSPRPDKKEQERCWAESALKALQWGAVKVESVKADPPDVRVVLADGRQVGVEVMQYHRDRVTAKSCLRGEEARIGEIEEVFGRERDRWPGVQAYGQVTLKKTQEPIGGATAQRRRCLPSRSEIDGFVRELLGFASEKMSVLSDDWRKFADFGSGFPLLHAHLEVLELWSYSWTPTWNFDPEAKCHGFDEEVWIGSVHEKSEKVRQGRQANPAAWDGFAETWLLLVSTIMSSHRIAASLDMFRLNVGLGQALDQSPFGRVLIHEDVVPSTTWVWQRGTGWTKVCGG